MANQNSGFRFDHREIAVIFSLFIFVSLLMFTVGILVGKGLAQARYEGTGGHSKIEEPAVTEKTAHLEAPEGAPTAEHEAPTGTSVSMNSPSEHHAEAKKAAETPAAHAAAAATHPAVAQAPHGESAHAEAPAAHGETKDTHSEAASPHRETAAVEDEPATDEPLQLVPKKKVASAKKELFPATAETEGLFKNPKVRDIFEKAPGEKALAAKAPEERPVVAKAPPTLVERDFMAEAAAPAKRQTASVPAKFPMSYPEGKFTVQAGSYPDKGEAMERVETLKKLGYPFAYFSAKELEDNKTWYRVWLGYYPDHDSAKAGAEVLRARGEVKTYIVRKTDSDSAKN